MTLTLINIFTTSRLLRIFDLYKFFINKGMTDE